MDVLKSKDYQYYIVFETGILITVPFWSRTSRLGKMLLIFSVL